MTGESCLMSKTCDQRRRRGGEERASRAQKQKSRAHREAAQEAKKGRACRPVARVLTTWKKPMTAICGLEGCGSMTHASGATRSQ